ncbi:50S ribosomal protein L25 [Thraustotheca clavata]|uniref:50S ribosomal protein L25 n=1 Tax=Thraustotheca clavata TaxID=74557 RepID=A0A1V9ZYZ7_9STRA|nr:50S ribosomal protein L25 [Thraustotheca clavata]
MLMLTRQSRLHGVAFLARNSSSVAVAPTLLQLHPRPKDGSRESRRLRRSGLLPGILYGEGSDGENSKVLVSMNQTDFEREYRKLRNSMGNQVYEVAIGDAKPTKVLLRDITLHPVTDVPLTVNFLRFKPGRTVHIPLAFLNEETSPGLKRGGYINNVRHEIPCKIDTETIPTTLDVDVNGMHVGQRIYLENITFPENVTPLVKERSVIATIAGKRGLIPKPEVVVEEVVEEEEEEEEEEYQPVF